MDVINVSTAFSRLAKAATAKGSLNKHSQRVILSSKRYQAPFQQAARKHTIAHSWNPCAVVLSPSSPIVFAEQLRLLTRAFTAGSMVFTVLNFSCSCVLRHAKYSSQGVNPVCFHYFMAMGIAKTDICHVILYLSPFC